MNKIKIRYFHGRFKYRIPNRPRYFRYGNNYAIQFRIDEIV